MRTLILFSAVFSLAFAQPAPSPKALVGDDAKQAMALANAWGAQVQSYVTTEAVVFKFPGQTIQVALPRDQQVVAIAPYISQTHPCNTHYMSSCRGELAEVPVRVLARTADGKTIFSGTLKTQANGFVELWLPRNLDLKLSLEANDKRAEGLISTHKNSDTCITTFQLR